MKGLPVVDKEGAWHNPKTGDFVKRPEDVYRTRKKGRWQRWDWSQKKWIKSGKPLEDVPYQTPHGRRRLGKALPKFAEVEHYIVPDWTEKLVPSSQWDKLYKSWEYGRRLIQRVEKHKWEGIEPSKNYDIEIYHDDLLTVWLIFYFEDKEEAAEFLDKLSEASAEYEGGPGKALALVDSETKDVLSGGYPVVLLMIEVEVCKTFRLEERVKGRTLKRIITMLEARGKDIKYLTINFKEVRKYR